MSRYRRRNLTVPLPEFHHHPCFPRQGLSLASSLCVLALLLTGCGDGEEIRVYTIPKESEASSSSELRPASNPSTNTTMDFAWQLPGDWEEIPPAGMRVAHFTVPDGEGRPVEGYVVPLRGITDQETDIVNLWRAELDLADLTTPQLEQEGMPIQIGDTRGRFYDFTSPGPKLNDQFKARILAAVTLHEGTTWCFKAIGRESAVAGIKEQFIELLGSVDFHPPPGAMARADVARPVAAPPPGNRNLPNWEIPPDWERQTPGPMLLAQFNVPSETDASAEVTVSSFPGDVGGLLANVNRWRVQQLGLPPVSEAELDSLVTSLDVPGGEAMLVDMTGSDATTGRPARIVTAVHPHAGQTWFYKLMGDPGMVASQLDAFTRFVQSVRHDQ